MIQGKTRYTLWQQWRESNKDYSVLSISVSLPMQIDVARQTQLIYIQPELTSNIIDEQTR